MHFLVAPAATGCYKFLLTGQIGADFGQRYLQPTLSGELYEDYVICRKLRRELAATSVLPLTKKEYDSTLIACGTPWNTKRGTTRRFFPWLLALSASTAVTAAASGR